MTLPYSERFLRFYAGFFRNKADESMTRAVTLLLALGAVLLCGAVFIVAVYAIVKRQSLDGVPATIAAICGCLAPLVAGGVVALVNRTKSTDMADVEIPPAAITQVKP